MAATENGNTALDLARQGGHTEVVEYIPEAARARLGSLRIRFTTENFVEAAVDGDLVVVKLFVEAGMSVDTADENGYTVLHHAAGEGHLAIVKYLVGQGASLTARGELGGFTVLMAAAIGGDLAIVKYLVEQGVDVGDQLSDGRMAKDAAEYEGHTEVVEYLDSVGG